MEWLLGQPCWGVAAGAGTGSVVSIHFGRKLRRARECRSSSRAADLRVYEGEVILFVECDWALANGKGAVCDSRSDNSPGGPMLRGLRRMIGSQVREIILSVPPRHLSLRLTKGLEFKIAAQVRRGENDSDNFTLFLPGVSCVVGPDLRLRVERREVAVTVLGRELGARSGRAAG